MGSRLSFKIFSTLQMLKQGLSHSSGLLQIEIKIIKETPLGVDDLKKFQGLKLVNALRDMDQALIPINALVH